MPEKILVTTEQLIQRKEEYMELLKEIEKAFLQAAQTMDILERCFCGRPVTDLKRKFLIQEKAGENALKDFKDYVEGLEEIALVYKKTERGNRDLVKTD